MNKQIKYGFNTGLKKGWSGFIWMLKILVPISLFTALLIYSGWLDKIDFLIEPAMNFLSLPAIAALPLIIGLLTGIYAAVAAMMILPLTVSQMTLVAIFLLISHNMIQESIVQGKAGAKIFSATLIRISASILTTIIVALFIDTAVEPAITVETVLITGKETLYGVIEKWGVGTLYLCIKIFSIIMPLMIILEIMKATDMIKHIVKASSPFLKILGLTKNTGVLWLTGAIFGLAYGSAVIVEEIRENDYNKNELAKLHLSIGINHAMIEDPALFLPLGLNPLWLWIPRLITAIIAVQLYNFYNFCIGFTNKKRNRSRTRNVIFR